jgi:all-trans-nonaprenyl-diphosphate synthase
VSQLQEAQNTDNTLYKPALFGSVAAQLQEVERSLTQDLPAACGPLADIVRFIMLNGGKRLRPALTLLSGCLTSPSLSLSPKHYILAQLTELIHTASLVHDDLLDEADSRRGQESCHMKWGSKVAVIMGDFLFAQASVRLGELNNTEIVKIYAKVLADLCTGEVVQAQHRFNLETLTWQAYLNKSVSKTASLFAAATMSAAILNEQPAEIVQALFLYGQNLGIAFQIVDDLLDFTSTTEALGKPALGDLAQGVFTAPVLYALEDTLVSVGLKELIYTRFTEKETLLKAKELISSAGVLAKTHELANTYVLKAIQCLAPFEDNPFKKDLLLLGDYVLARTK